MKAYGGSADFEFIVERFLCKKTGLLVTEDAIPLEADDDEYEYKQISLHVEGRSYFEPGRYFGRPEDCYPDEGETEIISVVDESGKDWYRLLTKDEIDSISQEVDEYAKDDDRGCDYDCDDGNDDYFDPAWDNYDGCSW